MIKKNVNLPFVVMRQADQFTACYHTHSHYEFSFGVIDAGEAVYYNMGQNNHIGAGTTVTINQGDAHSCNPKSGKWSYRMLFIASEWIGRLQQEISGSEGYDFLPFSNRYESDMLTYHSFDLLFKNLLSEENSLISETLLIEFLMQHLFRQHESNDIKKTDSLRVKRIKELIMDRLNMNLSLDEFSDCSGLSRYHLIRSFQQEFGQSPHAFQLDQRIAKSKLLLQNGYSIVDTANLLGFSDQSYFQRNFKKRLAPTPKQYQAFFI